MSSQDQTPMSEWVRDIDFEAGRDVLALLWDETRRRDMTVLMVTHNTAFARVGDLVIRLRSGEVVEVAEGEAIHPQKLA